jgi:phospholipase A2-like protein
VSGSIYQAVKNVAERKELNMQDKLRKTLMILSACASIFYSQFSFAVCGSGSTEGLVPDKPGFNFAPACKKHDACYGTCGTKQATCDRNFHRDMRKICNDRFDKYDPRERACLEMANTYYSAVHRNGGDYHRKAQRKCG